MPAGDPSTPWCRPLTPAAGSGVPLVLAVGETVRQAVDGLALGLTCPVLRAPPERAARTRSRRRHGMIRPGRDRTMPPTLLALGAHYDDCVFGVPGLLVKAARRGYRVVLLALIGDYANFAPAVGREAALRAGSAELCAAHGAELRFLDLKSQHFEVTAETKAAVARAVLDVRPDVALTLGRTTATPTTARRPA